MSAASTSTTQSKTMDYFAIFGLPRKLWIEMTALEQKFLQLSWKLHPDNFVNASEQERELSLKPSSELNDAYRTLRDRKSTRLNSSHVSISYAVFCLKKKKKT